MTLKPPAIKPRNINIQFNLAGNRIAHFLYLHKLLSCDVSTKLAVWFMDQTEKKHTHIHTQNERKKIVETKIQNEKPFTKLSMAGANEYVLYAK